MFRKQVLTDKNIEDMKNNALDSRSSFLKRTIHNLKSNKPALIGGMVLLALIVIGFAAPLLAPHDPLEVETSNRLLSPSLQYPLGTDHMGRCILSSLMYATRTSLITALIILAGNLAIGIPLGLIAGYVGGKIDNLIMRVADIALTFPSSLILLAVIGIFGTNVIYMILVLTFLWWAPYARILRSLVIKLKEQDFVMAAEAAGRSKTYIAFKHIGLCSISPVIVLATLKISSIIMHVASYSFIGIGTQAPNADWGVMLSESREFIFTRPILIAWPAIVIVIVVLCLNIFGEGLKDALLPNTRMNANSSYKGD